MSQPIFIRLRKFIDPRPYDRGRGPARMACASDVILAAMVVLFVGLVVFRILLG
ncbi:hypothetical protein PY650_09710 [Rhizobium calliandrae]|uniref:Uncharacterized protein n=1 Tax=Rhizobium calliandrae TaxID=1312182 RepID=A0ABT7KBE8_9HYPH|nr:hypothetical protein [Rhizobium calliandrae]MDL2405936.1 hypothetical protein [Rhizobium calliandrae]